MPVCSDEELGISSLYHLPVDRKDTIIAFVLDNLLHQLAVDLLRAGRVAIDEGGVAEDVDHARNAVTGVRREQAGFVCEQVHERARGAKPEADIFAPKD